MHWDGRSQLRCCRDHKMRRWKPTRPPDGKGETTAVVAMRSADGRQERARAGTDWDWSAIKSHSNVTSTSSECVNRKRYRAVWLMTGVKRPNAPNELRAFVTHLPSGATRVRPPVIRRLEVGLLDQRESRYAPLRCDAETPGDAQADTRTNPLPRRSRSGCRPDDRAG